MVVSLMEVVSPLAQSPTDALAEPASHDGAVASIALNSVTVLALAAEAGVPPDVKLLQYVLNIMDVHGTSCTAVVHAGVRFLHCVSRSGAVTATTRRSMLRPCMNIVGAADTAASAADLGRAVGTALTVVNAILAEDAVTAVKPSEFDSDTESEFPESVVEAPPSVITSLAFQDLANVVGCVELHLPLARAVDDVSHGVVLAALAVLTNIVLRMEPASGGLDSPGVRTVLTAAVCCLRVTSRGTGVDADVAVAALTMTEAALRKLPTRPATTTTAAATAAVDSDVYSAVLDGALACVAHNTSSAVAHAAMAVIAQLCRQAGLRPVIVQRCRESDSDVAPTPNGHRLGVVTSVIAGCSDVEDVRACVSLLERLSRLGPLLTPDDSDEDAAWLAHAANVAVTAAVPALQHDLPLAASVVRLLSNLSCVQSCGARVVPLVRSRAMVAAVATVLGAHGTSVHVVAPGVNYLASVAAPVLALPVAQLPDGVLATTGTDVLFDAVGVVLAALANHKRDTRVVAGCVDVLLALSLSPPHQQRRLCDDLPPAVTAVVADPASPPAAVAGCLTVLTRLCVDDDARTALLPAAAVATVAAVHRHIQDDVVATAATALLYELACVGDPVVRRGLTSARVPEAVRAAVTRHRTVSAVRTVGERCLALCEAALELLAECRRAADSDVGVIDTQLRDVARVLDGQCTNADVVLAACDTVEALCLRRGASAAVALSHADGAVRSVPVCLAEAMQLHRHDHSVHLRITAACVRALNALCCAGGSGAGASAGASTAASTAHAPVDDADVTFAATSVCSTAAEATIVALGDFRTLIAALRDDDPPLRQSMLTLLARLSLVTATSPKLALALSPCAVPAVNAMGTSLPSASACLQLLANIAPTGNIAVTLQPHVPAVLAAVERHSHSTCLTVVTSGWRLLATLATHWPLGAAQELRTTLLPLALAALARTAYLPQRCVVVPVLALLHALCKANANRSSSGTGSEQGQVVGTGSEQGPVVGTVLTALSMHVRDVGVASKALEVLGTLAQTATNAAAMLRHGSDSESPAVCRIGVPVVDVTIQVVAVHWASGVATAGDGREVVEKTLRLWKRLVASDDSDGVAQLQQRGVQEVLHSVVAAKPAGNLGDLARKLLQVLQSGARGDSDDDSEDDDGRQVRVLAPLAVTR